MPHRAAANLLYEDKEEADVPADDSWVLAACSLADWNDVAARDRASKRARSKDMTITEKADAAIARAIAARTARGGGGGSAL